MLVTNDMLGLFEKFTPGFVKQYLNLAPEIKNAVQTFCQEINSLEFPASEHSFASEQDFSVLLDEFRK